MEVANRHMEVASLPWVEEPLVGAFHSMGHKVEVGSIGLEEASYISGVGVGSSIATIGHSNQQVEVASDSNLGKEVRDDHSYRAVLHRHSHDCYAHGRRHHLRGSHPFHLRNESFRLHVKGRLHHSFSVTHS